VLKKRFGKRGERAGKKQKKREGLRNLVRRGRAHGATTSQTGREGTDPEKRGERLWGKYSTRGRRGKRMGAHGQKDWENLQGYSGGGARREANVLFRVGQKKTAERGAWAYPKRGGHFWIIS